MTTAASDSSTSPTVAKYAARYVERYAGAPYHPEKNRRHATAVLSRYILPALGELRLDEVTPRHLAELQTALFARGLGFHTVQNAIFSGWGALWKAARTEGLVVGKPHGGLLWPRRELNPDPFTEDERRRILDWFECEALDVLPIVACVFLAGMRPSEACGLRWGDVDLETGRVVIERAIASREVTPGKTRNSRRSLRVGEELRGILKHCRPSWAKPGDLIVQTVRGNPVDSQAFGRYWFGKCLRRARAALPRLLRGPAYVRLARAARRRADRARREVLRHERRHDRAALLAMDRRPARPRGGEPWKRTPRPSPRTPTSGSEGTSETPHSAASRSGATSCQRWAACA